ncbi:MAG: XdhC family protein [Pelagimonas sp.]|jgi:xanthine dehydrogenase accessory factor|nr:XdhC family protein [Pelagimonas sp.]
MSLHPTLTPDLADLARSLRERGEVFALATVVRTHGATAAKPGAKALTDASGDILHGWIGGGCVRAALRRATQSAIETGTAQLVQLHPQDVLTDKGLTAGEISEGARIARNGCPSKGSLEVFVEPVLPNPELVIFGSSPIAQELAALAPRFDWHVRPITEEDASNLPQTHAPRHVVIATQGQGDLPALIAGLALETQSIAFVGSHRKFAALSDKLVAQGLSAQDIARIQAPAGLAIDAKTPAEVALSILAQLIRDRRQAERQARL